jgi:hypothetical protein
MADNVTLPGTGTIAAADEIGGVQYQRVKLIHGPDGVNSGDVAPGNGLPVAFTWVGLTDAELRATPVPVSGTFWQATQPVSFSWAGLTDAELRATPVPVSGTFWQATQPVSAASLPLPAGAATAALQSTMISDIGAMSGKLPATLGIKTAANSLSVAPASDATFSTGGYVANPSASFTRPADTTAYAVGDLVANSTTADSVVAPALTVARVAAGSAMIRRLKLHKSGTSVTNASFRVHLFRSPPETVTNGDNGAFSVSGAGDYLGAWDVTIDRAFTDGAAGFGTPVKGNDQSIKLASGTDIRALIEARAAYTPASEEVFTVSLDCLQN